MRSQIEKNMEILCDDIEKLSCEKMTDSLAARLSAYRGAYKALCMVGEYKHEEAENTAAYTEGKPARTPELDGDTEFEQVLMEIPVDKAHVVAVYSIMADHMEQLAIVNRRAYDNIMLRMREVARK